jgi:hypothetical protein
MPFIRAALVKDLALVIEDDAFYFRLNLETFWYAGKTIDDDFQRFLADRRRLRCARVFGLKYCSRFLEPGLFTGLSLFDGADFVSRHLQPQSELGL